MLQPDIEDEDILKELKLRILATLQKCKNGEASTYEILDKIIPKVSSEKLLTNLDKMSSEGQLIKVRRGIYKLPGYSSSASSDLTFEQPQLSPSSIGANTAQTKKKRKYNDENMPPPTTRKENMPPPTTNRKQNQDRQDTEVTKKKRVALQNRKENLNMDNDYVEKESTNTKKAGKKDANKDAPVNVSSGTRRKRNEQQDNMDLSLQGHVEAYHMTHKILLEKVKA